MTQTMTHFYDFRADEIGDIQRYVDYILAHATITQDTSLATLRQDAQFLLHGADERAQTLLFYALIDRIMTPDDVPDADDAFLDLFGAEI